MHEYTFVAVPVRIGREGATPEYQDAIGRHAADGWRLVQVLVENPPAVPSTYTLIFERPVPVA